MACAALPFCGSVILPLSARYQDRLFVANLRLSGFFRLVSNWVVARARHPLVLLIAMD
jgi:hypothetical protein